MSMGVIPFTGESYPDDTATWCGRHAIGRADCGCTAECHHGLPINQCPDCNAAPPTGFASTVLTRAQLQSIPPVRSGIHGVLSVPSAAVIAGPYGIGKTFLTLAWGLCLANGIPWLGHDVEPMRVLYIVGEGAHGLEARIRTWETVWNGGTYTSDDHFRVAVKPASLKHITTWQQISQWAIDGGFRVVIFDTFSSLGPDVDETRDAPQVMRWLTDLAVRLDGIALLVHHPGWSDSGRTRGGYQLEGNADEVLILTGAPDDPLICLEVKKRKDGTSGAKFWLKRAVEGESVVISTANATDQTVPVQSRILASLDGYGPEGVTSRNLAAELDIAPSGMSSYYRVMGNLRKTDQIAREDKERGARWWLTEHIPRGARIAEPGSTDAPN